MKKQYFLTLLWIVLFSISLFSTGFSKTPKELDPATLQALKASLKTNAINRALINAVTNNDVKKLALNRELVNGNNEVFNLKTSAKGITDQKSSGRCWMFAGLNTMRPVVMKKFNLDNFEFSETYLFFWDKLEKANFILEKTIETKDRPIDDRELQTLFDDPVADGGWWNYVVNLVEKYGVVPKEQMPETVNATKSRMMDKIVGDLVRQDAAELRRMAEEGKNEIQLRDRKLDMLKDVYRVLAMHLGTPPDQFTWKVEDKDHKIIEKKFTPLQFYKDAVGLDLSQYVTILDYPVYPYNKHYQIDDCRNFYDAPDMDFINLDIDHIKQYTLKALENNEPVWFAADAGAQMDNTHGIMEDGIYDYESLYGIKRTMDKAERVQFRSSIPNHAMTFVAADTSNGKVEKWRVENSWGTDLGDKGYWTMYNNWFDKYVFTVIIPKKYIPEDVLAILKTKATRLPAWDPLRAAFSN